MTMNGFNSSSSDKGSEELRKHQNTLEELVRERASELVRLNEELKKEVADRKLAEAQLGQRTRLLTTLLDVSNMVSSTMELQPLLESILDHLKRIIDYKGAKIFILDGDHLRVIAHRSQLMDDRLKGTSLILMNCLWAMRLSRKRSLLSYRIS